MYIIWFKNVNVIYIYICIYKIDNLKATYIRYTRIISFPVRSTFPFFLRFYHWETVWSIYIRILKGSGILRTGTKIWLGRRNPSYHERYTDEVLDLQQLVIDKRYFSFRYLSSPYASYPETRKSTYYPKRLVIFRLLLPRPL